MIFPFILKYHQTLIFSEFAFALRFIILIFSFHLHCLHLKQFFYIDGSLLIGTQMIYFDLNQFVFSLFFWTITYFIANLHLSYCFFEIFLYSFICHHFSFHCLYFIYFNFAYKHFFADIQLKKFTFFYHLLYFLE